MGASTSMADPTSGGSPAPTAAPAAEKPGRWKRGFDWTKKKISSMGKKGPAEDRQNHIKSQELDEALKGTFTNFIEKMLNDVKGNSKAQEVEDLRYILLSKDLLDVAFSGTARTSNEESYYENKGEGLEGPTDAEAAISLQKIRLDFCRRLENCVKTRKWETPIENKDDLDILLTALGTRDSWRTTLFNYAEIYASENVPDGQKPGEVLGAVLAGLTQLTTLGDATKSGRILATRDERLRRGDKTNIPAAGFWNQDDAEQYYMDKISPVATARDDAALIAKTFDKGPNYAERFEEKIVSPDQGEVDKTLRELSFNYLEPLVGDNTVKEKESALALHKKIGELEEKAKGMKEELATGALLEATISDFLDKSKDATLRRGELVKAEIEGDMKDQEDEISKKEKEISDKKGIAATMETEVEAKEGKIKATEANMQKWKAHLDDLLKNKDNLLKERADVENGTDDAKTKESKLKELDSKLDEVSEKEGKAGEKIKEREEEIAKLKSEMISLRVKIRDLKGEIATDEFDVARYKAMLDNFKRLFLPLDYEGKIAKLEELSAASKNEGKKIDGEIENLTWQQRAIGKNMRDLEESISEKYVEIKRMEDELSKGKDEGAAKEDRKKITTLKSEIKKLEERHEAEAKAIEKLEKEKKEKEDKGTEAGKIKLKDVEALQDHVADIKKMLYPYEKPIETVEYEIVQKLRKRGLTTGHYRTALGILLRKKETVAEKDDAHVRSESPITKYLSKDILKWAKETKPGEAWQKTSKFIDRTIGEKHYKWAKITLKGAVLLAGGLPMVALYTAYKGLQYAYIGLEWLSKRISTIAVKTSPGRLGRWHNKWIVDGVLSKLHIWASSIFTIGAIVGASYLWYPSAHKTKEMDRSVVIDEKDGNLKWGIRTYEDWSKLISGPLPYVYDHVGYKLENIDKRYYGPAYGITNEDNKTWLAEHPVVLKYLERKAWPHDELIKFGDWKGKFEAGATVATQPQATTPQNTPQSALSTASQKATGKPRVFYLILNKLKADDFIFALSTAEKKGTTIDENYLNAGKIAWINDGYLISNEVEDYIQRYCMSYLVDDKIDADAVLTDAKAFVKFVSNKENAKWLLSMLNKGYSDWYVKDVRKLMEKIRIAEDEGKILAESEVTANLGIVEESINLKKLLGAVPSSENVEFLFANQNMIGWINQYKEMGYGIAKADDGAVKVNDLVTSMREAAASPEFLKYLDPADPEFNIDYLLVDAKVLVETADLTISTKLKTEEPAINTGVENVLAKHADLTEAQKRRVKAKFYSAMVKKDKNIGVERTDGQYKINPMEKFENAVGIMIEDAKTELSAEATTSAMKAALAPTPSAPAAESAPAPVVVTPPAAPEAATAAPADDAGTPAKVKKKGGKKKKPASSTEDSGAV